QEGLKHTLVSRVKAPWSIYTKMRQEHKSLEQVLDVFGFRIVVSTVSQCYQALGAVHSVYKPLDGRFRDFIAIPKANGYQSLHTVLFGPYGAPVAVKIRTEDMDLVAERGITAHSVYKTGGAGGSAATARAQDCIRSLMDCEQAARAALVVPCNVMGGLCSGGICLFATQGDLQALPRNVTALDYLCAVHTDVGYHAVAAEVGVQLVLLSAKLVSGQNV